MTKHYLYLGLLSVLLTSCATIVHKPQYEMQIYSDLADAKALVQGNVYQLPAVVTVDRSKQDLDLTLLKDSLAIDYVVKPQLTERYKTGNLVFIPMSYLIDLTNEKRFYYGETVFLDSQDSLRIIGLKPPRIVPKNHRDLYLNISLPYVNTFYLKPQGFDSKSNTGFFGLGLGVDYHYSKRMFLNANVAFATDLATPVPASVTYDGEHELFTTGYISVSNNHLFNRFSVGYGLSFANNSWKIFDRKDALPGQKDIKKSHNALGLVFPVYGQLGKAFHLGVVYRPTFFTPSLDKKFEYEHLISFELAWKIRLKKQ